MLMLKLIIIKWKRKCSLKAATMLQLHTVYKIYLKKAAYFSKIYSHTSLQAPRICGACGAPTL
jgi:hypothetical protein